MDCLTESSEPPFDTGTIIILVLEMRTLRLSKLTFPKSHSYEVVQCQKSNPNIFIPRICLLYCCTPLKFFLKQIRWTDAEAEASILWPADVKSWLIRKDPDAGKDWRQEKGVTENEIVGSHHWFNGHESEQGTGGGEGQESLACCSPWGHKESDTTEWLNHKDGAMK